MFYIVLQLIKKSRLNFAFHFYIDTEKYVNRKIKNTKTNSSTSHTDFNFKFLIKTEINFQWKTKTNEQFNFYFKLKTAAAKTRINSSKKQTRICHII